MHTVKLGMLGAVIIGAILALLWATGAVPPEDLGEAAGYAFGGLLVLVVAAAALRMVRGHSGEPDHTDRPVP